MSSAAQILANKSNSIHSTGPRTDAGKETSSRNAITHGLCATRLLLSTEEQSDFDQLRSAFLEAYKPKTDHELVLFEDTVRAHWFWTRAQAAHTAFLEAVVEAERKADPKLSPDQALARVFTDDKHAKRFRLLMRYESAAERTYRKNLAELERALLARATADEHRRRIAAARRMRESERQVGFVSQPFDEAAFEALAHGILDPSLPPSTGDPRPDSESQAA